MSRGFLSGLSTTVAKAAGFLDVRVLLLRHFGPPHPKPDYRPTRPRFGSTIVTCRARTHRQREGKESCAATQT